MNDYEAEFKAAGMNPVACHKSLNYRQYFLNGFGVSLAQSEYTLGGEEGLWELAVLHRQPHARWFTFCYTTALAPGLIGNLSVAEALALVARIQALDITGKEVTV